VSSDMRSDPDPKISRQHWLDVTTTRRINSLHTKIRQTLQQQTIWSDCDVTQLVYNVHALGAIVYAIRDIVQ